MPRRRRRSLAPTMTWIVLAIQALLLATLTVDASEPPGGVTLLQDLWALSHKPSFYPLVALIVIALPLTWLAWSTRGSHRWLLVCGWLLFIGAAWQWHTHRLAVMLRVLWDHGSSM